MKIPGSLKKVILFCLLSVAASGVTLARPDSSDNTPRQNTGHKTDKQASLNNHTHPPVLPAKNGHEKKGQDQPPLQISKKPEKQSKSKQNSKHHAHHEKSQLPSVSHIEATLFVETMDVELHWTGLHKHPSLEGYRIYRQKQEDADEQLLNPDQLIPPNQNAYTDTTIQEIATYFYRVVAVSRDGIEGKSPHAVPAFIDYGLTPYPYEESFDSVSPNFRIPESSEWAIAEDHDTWTSFSNNWHLDNNPTGEDQEKDPGTQTIRAAMKKRVLIPPDADAPVLSYWYKLDLAHQTDMMWVEIHYVDKKTGHEISIPVKKYLKKDNTNNAYAWECIPLHKNEHRHRHKHKHQHHHGPGHTYTGVEVWVSFHQKIVKNGPGRVFVIDDLRISDLPYEDTNNNNIPDAYETPMNADMLPYVKNLSFSLTDIGAVKLTWTPIENQTSPALAGYNVYRKVAGSSENPVKVNTDLIPPDASDWTDITLTADGDYEYYIVGVSDANIEGYPSITLTAHVVIPPPVMLTHPEDLTVNEWEPAELKASAKGLNMSYQWQKKNQNTDEFENIENALNPILSFQETVYADNGIFRCKIFNHAGEVFSNTAQLTIIMMPPKILTQPLDLTVSPGDPIQLAVVVKGSLVSYQWQRFNADLTGADSATYTKDKADCTDGGVFQCIISNDAGMVKTNTITLTITDDQPPVLTINGDTQITTSDDFITLTGSANDSCNTIAGVTITSNQYIGQTFAAITGTLGDFTAQVPLKIGDNQLTVTATDTLGNAAAQTIKVTLELAALPRMIINTPANGSTLTTDTTTLSGIVRSSLPPEQIRLVFNNTIQFPTGTNNEYTFTYNNVRLTPGYNTLVVTAETPHGSISARTSVTWQTAPPQTEDDPAVFDVNVPQPEIHVTEDSVTTKGTVCDENGIQTILVNDQAVTFVGTGNCVSFEYETQFTDTGSDQAQIIIKVIDNNGNITPYPETITYFHDNTAPVITIPGLQPAPLVNTVTTTPYTMTGTIVEKNLASLSVNNTSITALPTDTDDTWTFSLNIPLDRNNDIPLTIEARDRAGNYTGHEVILNLGSSLDIEVISPKEGDTLSASETTLDVDVTVRVPGIAADDTVTATIDSQTPVILPVAGTTAYGTINIQATNGEHEMAVTVKNTANQLLSSTITRFTVTNTADTPLKIVRQEPENNAAGVDINQFMAFYFNKPIDPSLLDVRLYETAHGLIYEQAEKGADMTKLGQVNVVEVHKDRELVNGGLSHFPENTMAAFYPKQDFAYDATIYVEVDYDGEELSRTRFTIRSLPTFIKGFVSDMYAVPVESITISIPKLGLTAVTNKDGDFGFGFGLPDDQNIPGGRYLAIINPNLKNRNFGSVLQWFNVEQGRLNNVGIISIPILDPEEPFRYISSNQTQDAILAGGDLTLNLSNTRLIFPNGRDQGDVQVQFLRYEQVTYPFLPSTIPHWVFSTHPIGIEVSGNMQITFNIPPLFNSLDYVAGIGKRVVLVGLDPDALQIVPVGVGLVDTVNNKVQSQGNVNLKTLDYIGYAIVPQESQALLEQYANGEISLSQMIGQLTLNP